MLIRIVLIALAVGAYWQAMGYRFVEFDDPDYVIDNRAVREGMTLENVRWAFTTPHAANWHPLTWMSLMVDTDVYRGDPRGYHITNIALHALNVVLLFGLLQSLTTATWRSAFAAALLAVHPMHVESVAWITERKDVLSLCFWLAATLAYIGYARYGGIGRYLLTAAMLALGLMAKPMVLTLPLVLLLLDFWPLGRTADPPFRHAFWRSLPRLLLEKVPLVAMAIASAVITLSVQVLGERIEDGVWMSLPVRLENVVVSYVRYLGKLLWPVNLAALYPNPSHLGNEFWSGWQVAASAVLLLAITLTVFALGRRRRYLIVGWLWYLGVMTPVIGFVQIGRHSMADRYAYIPFIGLYIMIAWGLADLTAGWRRRTLIVGSAATAVIAACTAATIHQVGYWRDTETLFRHAIAVTHDNWLAHYNLGVILHLRSNNLEMQAAAAAAQPPSDKIRAMRDEAAWHLEEAVRINPDTAWLRDNLADVYDRQGRLYDAQVQLERGAELAPIRSKSHWALGFALAKRGLIDQGLHHCRRAVELDPSSPEAHLYLGLVLGKAGLYDEALEHMEKAIELKPELAKSHGRALALIRSARGIPTRD